MEDYTHIKDPKLRHAMARLRTSAHRLFRKRKICTTTNSSKSKSVRGMPWEQIDDEYHFIMICEKYKAEREALISSIIRICPNFSTLTELDKFLYVMTAGREVQVQVAKFVKDDIL